MTQVQVLYHCSISLFRLSKTFSPFFGKSDLCHSGNLILKPIHDLSFLFPPSYKSFINPDSLQSRHKLAGIGEVIVFLKGSHTEQVYAMSVLTYTCPYDEQPEIISKKPRLRVKGIE